MVHLDLKPTNILLDDSMVTKLQILVYLDSLVISNPELSPLQLRERCKLLIQSSSYCRCFLILIVKDLCLICKTCSGYMTPEYINNGLISYEADIFSLGVIIIEVTTGCRGYPYSTGGEDSSVPFAEKVR